MFRLAGESPAENIGGDSVTLSDSESAYIVGHKGIREFSAEKISVKMHGYTLEIEGQNLKIACITEDEAFVTGKIDGVKRQ